MDPNIILYQLQYSKMMQRINIALAKGGTTSGLREIDISNPTSWEFSAFSQNGEDGIIDFLTRKIKNPNNYFIEIGSSDGIENNSAWLAIARKFSGLMIEGNSEAAGWAEHMIPSLSVGVECINMFVNLDNIHLLENMSLHLDPDVFSLDIDSNDYYIAHAILELGFRPKIFVVEYNSSFGPELSLAVQYSSDFDINQAHETALYYGCSITGWKKLFERYGYKFVTVDQNGVNGFFIKTDEFDETFVSQLMGCDFRENYYQMRKFRTPWLKQFELISNMPFVEITKS